MILLGNCKKVWLLNFIGKFLFLGLVIKIKEIFFSKLSEKNDLIFSIKLFYF